MKDVQQSRWRRMSCLSAALTWWYCAVSVCVRVCVEGFIYLHGWPSARNRKRRTGLGSEGLLEKHHASSRSIDIKAGDSFGWLDPGSIWNGCPTPFTLSEWASGSHSVPHQILFKGLSPKRKKQNREAYHYFGGWRSLFYDVVGMKRRDVRASLTRARLIELLYVVQRLMVLIRLAIVNEIVCWVMLWMS